MKHNDDNEFDLFYYAFNYRNASTPDAEEWWKALEDFVEEKIAQQQAQIDMLMLEFCPEEMTDEQMINWERHQTPLSTDDV